MSNEWTHDGRLTRASVLVLAVFAAIAFFAFASVAPTGTSVAPDAALACGQDPHNCGNGGNSAGPKPGCGYGDTANHVGPPGHDRVKGNWDQDQRSGETAARQSEDAASYGSGPTPQECPASAGGKK